MLALKGSALRPMGPFAPVRAPSAPPPAAEAVWPKGTVHAIGRDAALYGEGDPAASWYRLVSGTIRIVSTLRDGRRHIGEFVFPGQVFGFEPGPVHVQGAEAVAPAAVIVYPLERIEQRMAEDARARHAIRNLLVERLAAAQHRALTLGGLDAKGRLAGFLLAMAQRGPAREVAELAMSRVDIADYLGLTVETVSRVFTAFRSRGAIRLPSANRVEILDRAALEAASVGTVKGDAIGLLRR